ncbi:MAG: hypothetical protein ACJ8KX_01065 [Chthoniobacterales bacterium]
MTDSAGIAKPVREEEPITRTAAILKAALRVWELKNGHDFRAAWDRRVLK